MISPDSYLASRQVSKEVDLKNIRSIGEEGTRFENALCTSPLCGPARASLFTGEYPPYLTNGERAPRGMKRDLEETEIIFQQYLKKAGYNTKHVGKCHVGAAKFMEAFDENDDAWNRWAPPLHDDDDYIEFLKEKGVTLPVYSRELRGKQVDRKTPGNSLGGFIEQEDGKPFPLDAHYSMYLADKAVKKLEAAAKQASNKPIYLQLDFFDPHQPFTIPDGFRGRYQELRGKIHIPESFLRVIKNDFKPLPNEPAIYSVYRRYWGAYDEDLVKDYIVCHLLQMEVVDKAVGRLLDGIKSRGLWEDSLVIFSGDHGEINGRLGLFDKGVYFQPDIFRIPLLVKCPKSIGRTADKVEEPASSMDISRTILSFAGIEPNKHMDGEDLSSVLSGKTKRAPLNQLFQTGWHVGVNYGIGMNMFEDPEHHWFYGYNISSGEQEIYNMAEDDPVNVFDAEEYKDVKQRLVLRLAEILQSDDRWLGYWATFRLHNAGLLPAAEGDMQMFKPK
jgi:arylsulfatase A-like enzyme